MPLNEREAEATLESPVYNNELEQQLRESEAQLDAVLEALGVSQAHLSALIENTDDMIASYDRDLCLLVFNTAYRTWIKDLSGLTPQVGMNLDELMPGALYALMRDDCKRALAGEQFCKEFTYDFGLGDLRSFEVSFNPIVKDREVMGFSSRIRNITQYKRAEEALLESEQRFRNLFENSPDAVFVENLAGDVLDVNPIACQLHGISREELIGKNVLDLVPPDWRSEVWHWFSQMAAGQQELFESVSLAQDGRVVPVEIGVTHIEHLGQPALLLQMRDITARKEAEAAQLRRNRELAMLNRASQALTSTLNQDQILAIVAEEVRRLLGVFACSIWLADGETNELVCRQASGPKSELVLGWRLQPDQGIAGWVASTGQSLLVADTQVDGRHFWGVANRIEYDLRSILTVPLRVRQKVLGVLQVVDQEVGRFTHADMTLLEPLAVAAAIAIENARLVEGLEGEVAARTAEIVAERDRREAILQSVGDAIVMVDEALSIQYVNPAFERLTGYAAEEAMGQGVRQLIWEDVAEQARLALEKAHENGVGWRGELSIRRKDGRTCETMMTMAPVRDAEGDLQGYVISHQDIGRFKDLDRARRQFITNVSHQLRTPITTLKLQAYLMQKQEQSESNRRYLKMMETQIVALVQLIEDIIAMTVLDSGQAVRAWDVIPVTEIFAGVVDRFRAEAERKELEFVCEPSPLDTWAVRGDSLHLLQALGRIVQNAIKFTPSGGRITFSVRQEEDEGTWVALSVQDTGPGIPLDEQEKIFDRFFQGSVSESGHVLGAGLGLSFAQEVVQAHGGRITVTSCPGEGATFTVWLPLVM